MSKYRTRLPQLDGGLFLTDGGIETTLIFHDGLELPYFAAVHLMRTREGRAALAAYFERYLAIAREEGTGFILESPTWRASGDWGDRLGYTRPELAAANRAAIGLMAELRDRHECQASPVVVSGCVGPRGDGYVAGEVMRPRVAEAYHAEQIAQLGEAGADMITAITMTNANEAVGITRAARAAGLPVAISFTVETDGRLPTGQSLGEAVAEVDAETGWAPAYYMINCAHPEHFRGALMAGESWARRVRGLRANASRRSHQELNEAPDLDMGDPGELGAQHGEIVRALPHINVIGGCCGTDHRHVAEMAKACRGDVRRAA